MINNKKHKGRMVDGNWDIDPGIKEAQFYEEPKQGCPKFIMKDKKCGSGLPEWSLK